MMADSALQLACRSCGGARSELRKRVVSNGAVQIVAQCLLCGRSASNPIRRLPRHDLLPEWDDSIALRYDVQGAQERAQSRMDWFAQHDEYLKSALWRAKRQLVLERSGGRCEGCRSARATQVHHLTYEHWQRELLWELVAVCDRCHEVAHSKPEVGA